VAIPDPITFKTNTSPLAKTVMGFNVGPGYGSNMTKVLLALEAYDAQKLAAVEIRQRLLYNLWKQCGKWLALKAGKSTANELFARRKMHITNLQGEALNELAAINPNLRTMLENYQSKKSLQGAMHGLKGLSGGYSIERELYLKHGKASGMTVSMSNVHSSIGSGNHRTYKALQKKDFSHLLASDVEKLLKVSIPEDKQHGKQVAFMNKIERLKYIVQIENDLCCDIDDRLISLTDKLWDSYSLFPYAMDKYGNLFVVTDFLSKRNVVQALPGGGNTTNFQLKQLTQFNHSTILAGADVICAGCIHIGWNARRNAAEPGVLSSIDNGSGHYKPSLDDLVRCVSILQQQGVDIGRVRVGDLSSGDHVDCWWGDDLLFRGAAPWPDDHTPNRGLLRAPPIMTTF